MNLAFDDLKEQWRVEKAALELADAQTDIQEVRFNHKLIKKCITVVYRNCYICLETP